MTLGEKEKIERIAAALGAARGDVRVGIGDDAAVIDHAGGSLVWTIDEQVEGTHFERALLSLEDVGYRATMAAASDLAAMGAVPLGALAAWVLPRDFADDDVEHIARGQRAACDALGAAIVGGNLARGPVLSIATTWLGTCEEPITRARAKLGDGVWISGEVGLASAGFHALSRKREAPAEALAAWRRPRARIAEGFAMARAASACIDVSDGLARDALHIAESSSARIAFDEAALRKHMHSATISVARDLGKDALEFALSGGEDYALLATSKKPIEGFVRIGTVERGSGVTLGARALGGEDGFDHFGSG